jgi:hypothetical protein
VLSSQTVSVNDGETKTVEFQDLSLEGYSSGSYNLAVEYGSERINDSITLIEEPIIEKIILRDDTSGSNVL